jgi:hypothetical protein
VKEKIMRMKLPAYFELVNIKHLPSYYFPQIFDEIGELGRPFGAIEPNICLRVEDIMGMICLIHHTYCYCDK